MDLVDLELLKLNLQGRITQQKYQEFLEGIEPLRHNPGNEEIFEDIKKRIALTVEILDLYKTEKDPHKIAITLNLPYGYVVNVINAKKTLAPIKRRRTKPKGTPGYKKPYPKYLVEEAQKLCMDTDWSFEEISKYLSHEHKIKIRGEAIRRWCRGHGVPRSRVRATLDQKNKAIKLLKAGYSLTEVAKKVGLSVETIRRYKNSLRGKR